MIGPGCDGRTVPWSSRECKGRKETHQREPWREKMRDRQGEGAPCALVADRWQSKRGGQRCCVGVKAGTPHAPPGQSQRAVQTLVLPRSAGSESEGQSSLQTMGLWTAVLCCGVRRARAGRKSPRAQNPRTRPSHRVASPSLSGGGRGPGPGPTRPAERSRPRRRAPPPSFLAVEQQGVPPKAGRHRGPRSLVVQKGKRSRQNPADPSATAGPGAWTLPSGEQHCAQPGDDMVLVSDRRSWQEPSTRVAGPRQKPPAPLGQAGQPEARRPRSDWT